jgi:predicted dehydrogenase
MKKKTRTTVSGLSRREFVKVSAAVGAGVLTAATSRMYAAGSDKIRLGLIGCGGRGRHDGSNCLNAATNVELAAMGDLFKDQLDSARNMFQKNLPDKVKVTDDSCFAGWDAFKKVLACDVDMVILTTPPHFRAEHLRAAVEAG